MNLFFIDLKILKQFLKINFYIFLIVNTGNFAQLAYQIFGGKLLNPNEYGILSSANSLIGLIALPLAIFFNFALKVLIEKKNLNNSKNFSDFFNLLNMTVIFVASFITLCIFFASTLIKNLLEISSNEVVVIIGLTTLFNFLSLPYIALAQSLKKYKTVSFIGSSNHFIRLLFFILIYYFYSKTYVSGLYANLFSFIIITLFAYFTVKNKIEIKFKINELNSKISDIFLKNKSVLSNLKSSSISTFFLTLMTSIDIILFRKLYPNDLSGFYSAISTLGKIPLFLSAITFTYFLTESSDNFYKKKNSKLILLYNLITNFLIFLFFMVIFKFYGSEILTLVFKEKYSFFDKDLYYLTFAFSFIGFIKILILYLFSKNDNGYALYLFFGILVVLILCILSNGYKEFINIMVYGYLLNGIFLSVYTLKKL